MKKILIALTVIVALTVCAIPSFAGDNDGKVNLNTATVEQLEAIEGIDHDLAESIVETREENGEFVDMSELLDLDGVDNSLLRQLKRFLYIEPASDCNC